MAENLKLIKQGAEAKLYVNYYLGKKTLIKERFKKEYRHPDLDASITKDRIKNEARAIVRCKTIGVTTPTLYLVDFERRRIYMQYYDNSITIKDHIIKTMQDNTNPDILNPIAELIGKTVRKLHDSNIIHGDLTTSNMLLSNNNELNSSELVMIDFGLSYIDASTEDKGVDLYVLERALISTHNDVPDLFTKILDSYKSSKGNVKEIISKFEEVRARGRKRTMVG